MFLSLFELTTNSSCNNQRHGPAPSGCGARYRTACGFGFAPSVLSRWLTGNPSPDPSGICPPSAVVAFSAKTPVDSVNQEVRTRRLSPPIGRIDCQIAKLLDLFGTHSSALGLVAVRQQHLPVLARMSGPSGSPITPRQALGANADSPRHRHGRTTATTARQVRRRAHIWRWPRRRCPGPQRPRWRVRRARQQ